MTPLDVLINAATRPADAACAVLDGLSDESAHAQPAHNANSIAWLLWHAARQMDYQVCELTGNRSVWEAGGWADRLGIDRAADDFGFGDSPDDVAALHTTDVQALGAHLNACTSALINYLETLSPIDLDEIVDNRWNPPVTRGVRLVSIIDDAAVHVGQAAYARGIVDGWSSAY